MVRIGVVRRLDSTGLGYQSRNFCRMLDPVKTLDIEHGEDIPGFMEYEKFLKDIDVMLTAETPYVYEAWNWAKMAGVKTFCQPNWELWDGLIQPNMPHPDQYLIPSYWHLKDFQEMFPNAVYLPPPTFPQDFKKAREINFVRTGKRRFVHIVGKPAVYDRNGWGAIMEALPKVRADFELVVYAQQEITGLRDPRVTYHIFDIEDQAELYTDFDAMIMPRRYGGLCLPMNEALMAGLPVIMTDIEPNNKILPKKWLCDSEVTARFEGRSIIDVYSPTNLAEKIEWLCKLNNEALLHQKRQAFEIGFDNYSDTTLKPKYLDLLGL